MHSPLRAPLALSAATVALLLPFSASASGLEVGGRTGFGLPLGQTAEDVKLKDTVTGQLPFQLDLGYRLDDHLMLGAYVAYAVAVPAADSCDEDGVSCSANDVRLGVQGAYHFDGIRQNSFWLGGGLGYEWFTAGSSVGAFESSATAHGMEFFHLQGGYDMVLAKGLRFGPYALFSLAQFSKIRFNNDVTNVTTSSDIDDKALHEWLFFGIKGTFDVAL